MKNATKRLEKSREFWLILGITLLFFLLRIPSLFEPEWYGDEGIYQTIGLALTRGRVLYLDIWDNKPPLLYYTYAFVHGELFLIRLLSLITGIFTIISFSLLANVVLKKTRGVIAAVSLFAILFGLPIFEGNIANAENFMLLPIITAVFLAYRACIQSQEYTKLNTKYLLIAGLLLGTAFLYKIVAVFDFAAIFIFILFCLLPQKLSKDNFVLFFKKQWSILVLLLIGFLLPFLLSLIFFTFHGALYAYIQAIFLSTVGYVGHSNSFFIPQGLLISKILLVILILGGIFTKRKKLSPTLILIGVWITLSLFNSFFSHRPYTHYLIVLLPPISLLGGLVFISNSKQKIITASIFIFIGCITLNFFDHWSIQRTKSYYTNFITYVGGNNSMQEYYSFFDKKAVRDEQIAAFIKKRMGEDDKSLFLWGNSAQLYYMTDTLPPGRFTVAYHINGITLNMNETSIAIKKQPRFIIILDNAPIYPFPMYNYKQILKMHEANIYERTY